MNKFDRPTLFGLGLLATGVVTMVIPSAALGDSIWEVIPFYLFIVSSLTAPFVLKRAKKVSRIAGYAFYLSWILFVLALFLVVTSFIYL